MTHVNHTPECTHKIWLQNKAAHKTRQLQTQKATDIKGTTKKVQQTIFNINRYHRYTSNPKIMTSKKKLKERMQTNAQKTKDRNKESTTW
jgi:hypothetical protein